MTMPMQHDATAEAAPSVTAATTSSLRAACDVQDAYDARLSTLYAMIDALDTRHQVAMADPRLPPPARERLTRQHEGHKAALQRQIEAVHAQSYAAASGSAWLGLSLRSLRRAGQHAATGAVEACKHATARAAQSQDKASEWFLRALDKTVAVVETPHRWLMEMNDAVGAGAVASYLASEKAVVKAQATVRAMATLASAVATDLRTRIVAAPAVAATAIARFFTKGVESLRAARDNVRVAAIATAREVPHATSALVAAVGKTVATSFAAMVTEGKASFAAAHREISAEYHARRAEEAWNQESPAPGRRPALR